MIVSNEDAGQVHPYTTEQITQYADTPPADPARPVLYGQFGRLLGAFALFEIDNLAATLLILHATDLITPAHGLQTATQIALGLYTAHNIAATVVSFPRREVLRPPRAARSAARGRRRSRHVPGVLRAIGSHRSSHRTPRSRVHRRGCAETAEHAAVALASEHLRGSAFGVTARHRLVGLLATVQAGGNVIASTIAGLLYTIASTAVAFGYVAACMAHALAALAWAANPPRPLLRNPTAEQAPAPPIGALKRSMIYSTESLREKRHVTIQSRLDGQELHARPTGHGHT